MSRHALEPRPWTPPEVESLVAVVAARTAVGSVDAIGRDVHRLVEENDRIHSRECVNLNPAANVMNPEAEALLSARLGSRPSLGYPGAKYETGLEAVEQLEVVAAELAGEIFHAPFVEVRVPSGSIANLYAFMAICRPGDRIIAAPAAIGGHVTHHAAGAAGLYGVEIVPAPVDAEHYTVDVAALRELAAEVRPRLITLGGSLNLFPHPVAAVREIADEVGARVMFDAAHLCGLIAGGQWPNPLDEGASVMTMSTYKSLAGPPGGLVVTSDAELAQRIEAVAHPGLTANFDAGKTAALAMTLLDWKIAGAAYAEAMVATAVELAGELQRRGVNVFAGSRGGTRSHSLALLAQPYGGGQRVARRLRQAHLLASGIGVPGAEVPDDFNGLRLGTPEATRIGMTVADMPALAEFLAAALRPDADLAAVGAEVTAWRQPFRKVCFTRQRPSSVASGRRGSGAREPAAR
jgi:glycine hydroxymethyltransferase